jgi:hypothetical protein
VPARTSTKRISRSDPIIGHDSHIPTQSADDILPSIPNNFSLRKKMSRFYARLFKDANQIYKKDRGRSTFAEAAADKERARARTRCGILQNHDNCGLPSP